MIEQLENRRLLTSSAPETVINWIDMEGAWQHIIPSNTSEITVYAHVPLNVTALAVDAYTGTLIHDDTDSANAEIKARWVWQFGDDGDGSEFNQLEGFNAAHIYNMTTAQSGHNYTLSLIVTNEDGLSSPVQTVPVHVIPALFDNPGGNNGETIYVAANSAGDNSGSSKENAMDFTKLRHRLWEDSGFSPVPANSRVLFKNGDTVDVFDEIRVKKSDVLFSVWDPEGPNVILRNTNPYTGGAATMIPLDGNRFNRVFEHLTFINGTSNGDYCFLPLGANTAIRDCVFTDLNHNSEVIHGIGDSKGLLFQDNVITGNISYVVWNDKVTDSVFVGNRIDADTGDHNTLIRLGAAEAQRMLIAHNDFKNVNSSVRLQVGAYASISDNTFVNTGSQQAIQIGARQADNDVPGDSFDSVVVERNKTEGAIKVVGGASHIMVRSNVVKRTLANTGGGNNFEVAGQASHNGGNFYDSDIFILSNTGTRVGYFVGADSDEAFFYLGNVATNITLSNNLYVTEPSYQITSNRYILYLGGLDLSSFSKIENNVWADPSNTTNRMRVSDTTITKANWTNANYPKVSGDSFSNVPLDLMFAPEDDTTPGPAVAVVKGVHGDLYGGPRLLTSSTWTVGAVERSLSGNIGTNTATGSTTVDDSYPRYQFTAGGKDIWGDHDGLKYFYRKVSGDFDFKVQVYALNKLDGTENYSVAGLMARLNLTDDTSANFFVGASSGDGFRATYRATTGGTTSNGTARFGGPLSQSAGNFPDNWVRLRREGNYFMGYASRDGVNWELIKRAKLDAMEQELYFGLATSAHTDDGHSSSGTVNSEFRQLSAVSGTTGLVINPRRIDGSDTSNAWTFKRSGRLLQVWWNGTGSGTPDQEERMDGIGSVTITGGVGTDAVVLDYSNGTVVPSGGLSFDGGSGTADTLDIVGGSGMDTASFTASSAIVNGSVAATFNSTGTTVEAVRFDGKLGFDALTVSGGTVHVRAKQELASLAIQNSAKLVMDAELTTPPLLVLKQAPSIASGASLDLGDGAMIIDYTGSSPASAIQQFILNGRGNSDVFGATWTGTGGIASSVTAGQNDGGIATAVGYAENSDMFFGPFSTFKGQTVDSTSILIRYTRGADANLDSNVDGTDLDLVATYYGGTGGWYQGDFNYDGNVDGSDLDELAFVYGATEPPMSSSMRMSMEGEAPWAGTEAAEVMDTVAGRYTQWFVERFWQGYRVRFGL
jgi:hypothetical protein